MYCLLIFYIQEMKKTHKDQQLNLFSDSLFSPKEKQPKSIIKYDHTDLFHKLAQSTFRSQFHLTPKDKIYIQDKGLETIQIHASDFISKRLAPAQISNDGKQTPMHGHPVFLAQHATACCCRSCLYKWHHIPKGRALTESEQNYIISILMTWIKLQS